MLKIELIEDLAPPQKCSKFGHQIWAILRYPCLIEDLGTLPRISINLGLIEDLGTLPRSSISLGLIEDLGTPT